jgi:hypothetical protein
MSATKLAWHVPSNGKKAHFHDRSGVTLCGAGWFTGTKVEAKPSSACKRCEKWLAEQEKKGGTQ